MDTIKLTKDNTKFISDGGYSLLELDNTYSAFLAAVNRNYYGIKCDIRFTKDRHMVTARKRDMSKIIKQKIHISQSTFAELNQYVLSHHPLTFMTDLALFLSLCKRYQKMACIEIHPPIGHLEINQLMEVVASFEMDSMVKLIANDVKYLKQMRLLNFEVHLELTADKLSDALLLDAIKYHLDIALPVHLWSKDLIDLCHEQRIKTAIWQVQNPVYARLYIEMGIDYLYTNLLE